MAFRMPMMGGGTHAHLPIDEELKIDVERVIRGEESIRAFKVVADGQKLVAQGTIAESDSVEEDFVKLSEGLGDKPCIALVRLTGCPGFEDTNWAMIMYTPDDAPVKERMLNASSKAPLQAAFKDIKFTEYQVTLKDEVTLKQFLEATRGLSSEERRQAMSQEERDHEDVKKQLKKEQDAAPKQLAGLVALKIKAADSFTDAVKTMIENEGKAVLGRLCGSNNEEISGEVLDAALPSALKGKLPTDEPCYVILKVSSKRLLVMSWLPEDCNVKRRMKCATFKASVIDLLKTSCSDIESIAQAEICDEDDLEDDLGQEKASAGYPASTEEAAPSKFKPPVGGFALPGMGGAPAGRKAPAGAVAMPGMADIMMGRAKPSGE